MSKLAEKIRKSRQTVVPIEGKPYKFVISRPTDLDVMDIRSSGGLKPAVIVERYVVGWEGVRELDILPGGDPHPLEFDRDACVEWLSDSGDVAGLLIAAILKSYSDYKERIQAAEKN